MRHLERHHSVLSPDSFEGTLVSRLATAHAVLTRSSWEPPDLLGEGRQAC